MPATSRPPVEPVRTTRYRRVRDLLLGECGEQPELHWPWLPADGSQVGRKEANKFVLGAIMDYQMRAEQVWKNAGVLSEDILGNTEDLWGAIAGKSKPDVRHLFRHHKLHRFPEHAADRTLRIAADIRDRYGGDARKIWSGQGTNEVMRRLSEMRVGPQISRMIIGGLIDTGQIKGKGELRANTNIRRMLGRVFDGRKASPDRALEIADVMEPGNSWRLNGSVFALGKYICKKEPLCHKCCLRGECRYAA